MKLTDKFPNAHPDAVRCFDDMMTAARGYDVFFAAIVAHQVMVQALYYIAQDYPDWKKEFAEQLRVTADFGGKNEIISFFGANSCRLMRCARRCRITNIKP